MKKFILSVIALVALLSGCASRKDWFDRPSFYKTMPGDTLAKIYCKFDSYCSKYLIKHRVEELTILNKSLLKPYFPLIDSLDSDSLTHTSLPSGIILRLRPKPDIMEDWYTVEEGDTLEEIASRAKKRFAGKVKELREWNNLGNRDIYVGQTLRVTDPAPDPEEALNSGAVMRVARDKYKIIARFPGMDADIHRVYFITRGCNIEGYDHNVTLWGKLKASEYRLEFGQHYYQSCKLINIIEN